jgi:hypothetical protein
VGGASVPLGESDPDGESNDADADGDESAEQRPLQHGRRFRRATSSRRALIDPSAATTNADGIELVDAPRPPPLHESENEPKNAADHEPHVHGRRVLIEPVNDMVITANVGGRCNCRRRTAYGLVALLATLYVLVLPALSGSVTAAIVVHSMTVTLSPVALPPVPPPLPSAPPFTLPRRLCTDVVETCSRFQSLREAHAHCDELHDKDDETFVECTVRGLGASRAKRELEIASMLAVVPPQASFVGIDGVDGRAMTQMIEVRSYDPESWQACVRVLDCD